MIENRAGPVILFVTVCTKDRRSVLACSEAHAALLDAWRRASLYRVGRYVIMPNHVHLFCAPAQHPPEPVAHWINYWKSVSARASFHGNLGKLWQRDFWDTQLRSHESYGGKWEYVRSNPVRAGLVSNPANWPYQGELNVLLWHGA